MKGGRKKPRIEYVRALLENGSLQITKDRCVDLLTEWITLSWSPDRQNHREGVPDDVSDSMLYAVYPLSQLFVPPEERPKPGTIEWRRAEDDREREASIHAGRRLKRRTKRRDVPHMRWPTIRGFFRRKIAAQVSPRSPRACASWSFFGRRQRREACHRSAGRYLELHRRPRELKDSNLQTT
jgi:hypothetical protein